ncbi:MAG: TetR/AcrR family transcriptional regulator [Pseudooceanicola sp.]
MAKPVQTRSRKTRARLVETAADLVARNGYEGLRVEDVVTGAGVAKGTLFAHFTDKDGLLAELVGSAMDTQLDALAEGPAPDTPADLARTIAPLIRLLASERTVFDILMRYSGGLGPAGNPIIADNMRRQIDLFAGWIAAAAERGTMRADQPPELLAEGVQAFAAQIVALHFCEPGDEAPEERMVPFLDAWLGVR